LVFEATKFNVDIDLLSAELPVFTVDLTTTDFGQFTISRAADSLNDYEFLIETQFYGNYDFNLVLEFPAIVIEVRNDNI
jgi:hypothetical protein